MLAFIIRLTNVVKVTLNDLQKVSRNSEQRTAGVLTRSSVSFLQVSLAHHFSSLFVAIVCFLFPVFVCGLWDPGRSR